ncbi:MAG: Acidobacterial duplicated orphan permease (function unknown) [uncultured Cytophagales bacterium]|uniref:ABC transporter, permease protein n=1 Tax=uncultured Cytophagales bacterium TaxID=158755 RepID=A0A6J4JYH2_9SPHI|nr:MAG: Acidobacterial duplicated orphan permease (function unknown) [uncultured Cytophagales bacterium]
MADPNVPAPPDWMDRLLAWLLPHDVLEEVLGDLHEVFHRQVPEKGLAPAKRAYLLRALPYLRLYYLKRKSRTYAYPKPLFTDMLRNYLTITFRTLARNKVYSGINILGLSIGLAAAMLILLYTKDEASYDRFHENGPRIYRIVTKNFNPDGSLAGMGGNTGWLEGHAFGEAIPEITSFVRLRPGFMDLKRGTAVEGQPLFLVDPAFFSVFSFPLLSGNPRTALTEPHSAVISEEMAQKQFGTTQALGKTLLFKEDGGAFTPYTVTGVAKGCPQNSSIRFDVLLPLIATREQMDNKENWGSAFLNTFVLLGPGVQVPAVEAKMRRVYEADTREIKQVWAEKYGHRMTTRHLLQPFTDMHLSGDFTANNGLTDSSKPVYSYILTGIAAFILLIASINFVNLTVARSVKRAKEIGIRKAIGGGRRQLLLQFLGESYLLSGVAFALALLLAQYSLPLFNEVSGKVLALSYLLDWQLVAAYLGLYLLTGLLAGFYPALVLSGFDPVQTLYRRVQLSGKHYLQKSLVVVQFALASFLIIAMLTVSDQFNYLVSKDLGYDDGHVISAFKGDLSHRQAALLKDELLKHPAILETATKNEGQSVTSAKVNGDTKLQFTYETIDEAYLPLFRIPVVRGRNFSPRFPSDSAQSVLVNETFAKEAGWKEPIGQTVDFHFQRKKYTVVGVVKDHHYLALDRKIGPQVFTMNPSNPRNRVLVRIRPGTETASVKHLEKTFRKLFPMSTYFYRFKDEENRLNYQAEARWKKIVTFGAAFTIFISCIGLFGMVALSAERRTKEIGIRKVMGSSIAGLVRLLTWDFVKLVGASFVFAFPAAWFALHRWLENYPYRTPLSGWLFALTAVLTLAVALFTVSFQSIKAALTNPARSLKSE